MTKKPGFFTIKDILPGVIDNISRQNVQDQISLENLWKEILGPDADKVVIVGVKEGSVLANVDCGARLFQMRMRKATLLSKIQTRFPDINNLIFKIGKVK